MTSVQQTPTVSGDPFEVHARLEAILATGIDEFMVSHVAVADEAEEMAALSEVLAG